MIVGRLCRGLQSGGASPFQLNAVAELHSGSHKRDEGNASRVWVESRSCADPLVDPSGLATLVRTDEKAPGIDDGFGGFELLAGTGFDTVETDRIAVLLLWAA